MNYNEAAKTILDSVGGASNINRIFNCATRLRLDLKDVGKADTQKINGISGVAGTNIAGNQLQVIVGTDVGSLCAEMQKIADVSENDQVADEKKEGIISIIAGIFTPLLPAIIGGGMVKAILALLTAFNLIDTAGQTYQYLTIIGNGVFYFLPFLVAYSASKKFKVSTVLTMGFAAVLMYPSLSEIAGEAAAGYFFGIPVVNATYSSSVIPIILIAYIQKYLEQFFDHVWKPVRSFLKPTLVLLVGSAILLIAVGPLGTWCGDLLASALLWINDVVPWLPPVIMGTLSPLIVMTGMHYSLIPLAVSQATTLGYITIDLPGMLAANVAQGGAALCVAFRTKNEKLKEIAASTGLTAVLGITEPAMYGVNLRLKRPFIGAMIGGAAGGLFAGFSGLKAFAPGSPGLATLPLFLGGDDPVGNLVKALITIAIALVVSFVATWFLGFEDAGESEKSSDKISDLKTESQAV